ncbi:MAG: PAS domain-containing protein, partial [Syntrophobacteraceae bacterium]|nr:PAS domain-containing protein [Syntrophobacteraceae bacterium]
SFLERIHMTSSAFTVWRILFALVFILSWAHLARGHQRPRVILLNSYHPGFAWSDREVSGLLERLREVYADIDPPIEYLDTKRRPTAEHLLHMKTFLVQKYEGEKVDVVVCLDNPALAMVLQFRDELFPDVPLVFAGINHFDEEMLAGRRHVTGVAEVTDIKGTLDLALRLHPRTRQVFVVNDHTLSGLAARREMEAVASSLDGRVKICFLPEATIEETVSELRSLPPDSLVLILSYATDKEGESMSLARSTRLLTAAAQVPVYGVHETRLGHGIVGGLLLGGREHGRRAGEMVLRILAGVEPDRIPVDTSTTSIPMFDHEQLQRFHIPLSALPPGSLLYNKPMSLLETHPNLVAGTLAVLILLSGMVLFLTLSVIRRRRVERALHESGERLRLALVAAKQGHFDLNLQTREVLITPEFARMLDYEPTEMRVALDRWFERLHPEDRGRTWSAFQAYVRGETLRYCVEFRQQTRSGRWKWILSQGEIVAWDAEGSPLRMLGIHTDITERKLMEEKVRELNEELEDRVRERTEQLESTNKELEAFAYSVSHDLRAPLRAIIGFTRILEDDYASSLDAEGRRVCSVVVNEARRMSRLIDDLLAFSRLSRTRMRESSIDMAALATSVFDELTTAEERDRIELRMGSLPRATGDENLIRQVWVNLLSNSIKFSSKRERAVVEVGGDRNQGETRYWVHDNGAGFDMGYADRLFGVFQRLHGEEEFEGTGVGLAIVQRVIHRHGGRVWAESSPNEGATFHFSLPQKGDET